MLRVTYIKQRVQINTRLALQEKVWNVKESGFGFYFLMGHLWQAGIFLLLYSFIMEQNLSILIADLSGYTALTEAHGSLSAADLIDKYIEIVDYSLVGVSRLHERVGDEVMIVSDIAHDLLLTAEKLYKNILAESNFLQVHGALHHGSLLKRKNNYFGSALNLTSRMVAQAKAGSFVCSRDFISALPHDLNKKFIPAGSHKFKNVAGSLELFEIVFDEAPGFNVDPICKMIIAKESISFRHPEKNDIFFCSQNCLDTYMAKKPGV